MKKIEYEKLKLFGTLFPNNRKKIEELFDSYLLEGVNVYMLQSRKMDDENLHILFSRKYVAEKLSFILLLMSGIFTLYSLLVPGIVCISLSIISFGISKLYNKLFDEYYKSTIFTKGILSYDVLEEIRDYLLEKEEK